MTCCPGTYQIVVLKSERAGSSIQSSEPYGSSFFTHASQLSLGSSVLIVPVTLALVTPSSPCHHVLPPPKFNETPPLPLFGTPMDCQVPVSINQRRQYSVRPGLTAPPPMSSRRIVPCLPDVYLIIVVKDLLCTC
jgi:hypothetical protein